MTHARTLTQVKRHGDVYVVGFSPIDVFDSDCLRDVRRLIGRLSRSEPRLKVVLDLADVVLLSSEAIGMIVAMNNALRPRGGRLQLANISNETCTVFEITRLRDIVEIFDSTTEAIASFVVNSPVRGGPRT